MSNNKTKLSKSILEMKFMKKTKEKVEKEADDEEGRSMYAGQITDKMLHGDCLFINEQSFVPCEDLIVGRLSFRGMNPEIERILELEDASKQAVLIKEQELEVTDKDMAKHYTTLVNTIGKKFNPKERKHKSKSEIAEKHQQSKRGKFIKPSDE